MDFIYHKNGVSLIDAALSGAQGIEYIRLRGRNTALSTSAELLAHAGSTFNPNLVSGVPTAQSFEVVSDSATDDAASTGAQVVTVRYVDSSWADQTTTANMDGTTAVSLGISSFGINQLTVTQVGTSLVNVGQISVQVASAGQVHRTIPGSANNYCTDHDMIFTVPLNKVLVVLGGHINLLSGADGAEIQIEDWDLSGSIGRFSTETIACVEPSATSEWRLTTPLVFPEKHRFAIRMKMEASVGEGLAMFHAVLIDKSATGTPFA